MSQSGHNQPKTAFSRETSPERLSGIPSNGLALFKAHTCTIDLDSIAELLYQPPRSSNPVQESVDLFGKPIPPVQAKEKAQNARCRSRNSRKDGTRTGTHRSATGGADPWYIYHSGNSVRLQIYSGELSVSTAPSATPSTPPPKRTAGDIDTFSRKSRMRVFQAFNRLQSRLLGKPVFITLTSRHGELDSEEFQYRFHKKFLPGLKQIVPKCCYIWRLQPHLNGKPHYHLLVWSFRQKLTLESEYYKRPIRKLWRDCIDQHDKAAQLYSCDIDAVAGMNKAFQYVSRYVAKEDEGKALEIPGRRWGRSKNYPANPIAEVTITRDRYNQLLEIVKVILRSRGKDTAWIDERVNDGFGWFVWLTSQEIEAILDYIHSSVGLSRYKRYQESGNPYPSDAELADLSERYGHDFAPDFGMDDLDEFQQVAS